MDGGKEKKRIHYTPACDIELLKKVLDLKPWTAKNGWAGLAMLMRRTNIDTFTDVEGKSLRDRLNLLLMRLRSNEMTYLRKSGTDEEYKERDALLQEVSDVEMKWKNKFLGETVEERSRSFRRALTIQVDGKVRQRIHYTPAIDIQLLYKVLENNPWGTKNGWGDLAVLMRRYDIFAEVEQKSLRDRINLLLVRYRREDMSNLKKTGTEEELIERDTLLQAVSDLEFKCRDSGKKRIYDSDEEFPSSKSARHVLVLTPNIAIDQSPPSSPRNDAGSASNLHSENFQTSVKEDFNPPFSSTSSVEDIGSVEPEHNSRANMMVKNIAITTAAGEEEKKLKDKELELKREEIELKKQELAIKQKWDEHRYKMDQERLDMEREDRKMQREFMEQLFNQQMVLMKSLLDYIKKE